MSDKDINIIERWKEFSLFHPHSDPSLSLKKRRYARLYMKARVCALSGDIEASRAIFDKLNQDEGYLRFEEKRADILAEIDILLDGHSRWQDDGHMWSHTRIRRV